MPHETIKNRAGTFYARSDEEGQFSGMPEKGSSLASDRRLTAKTVAKKSGSAKKRTAARKRSARA